MPRALRSGFLAFTVLVAVGCGSSEPTAPKENLSDKEKQQVKDLNKQREDEWKSTKDKK